MKREFLRELGLEQDVINNVMKEHGLVMREIPNTNIIDEIRAEKKQLEEQLTELQKQYENQDTKTIKLEVEELKKEKDKYKLTELKWQIANEYNLPLDMADRLTGTTKEELRTDAQRLLNYAKRPPNVPMTSSNKESRLMNMIRNLTE